MGITMFFVLVVLIILILIVGIPLLYYWYRAYISGVYISFTEILFMKFRKSPVDLIIQSLIMCTKADISVTRNELEAHALAGGNVINVVSGMIAAKTAGIELNYMEASTQDLMGINLLEYVEQKIK
jgi:uncharacterized protein YqfA (UPF0365 family)